MSISKLTENYERLRSEHIAPQTGSSYRYGLATLMKEGLKTWIDKVSTFDMENFHIPQKKRIEIQSTNIHSNINNELVQIISSVALKHLQGEVAC